MLPREGVKSPLSLVGLSSPGGATRYSDNHFGATAPMVALGIGLGYIYAQSGCAQYIALYEYKQIWAQFGF